MKVSSYAAMTATVFVCSSAFGQLVTAYTGDEAPPKNWIIDVSTGDDVAGPLGKSRALASDRDTNRIFEVEDRRLGRTTVAVRISTVGPGGEIDQGLLTRVHDSAGRDIRFIESLAFGNGVLYAERRAEPADDIPATIGVIDLDTYTYTPIESPVPISTVRALTFDPDRGELIIGTREESLWSLYAFDPLTGENSLIATLPTGQGFDGLGYGDGRIWMDCGAPCGPIQVYNRVTSTFEDNLPLPRRFGNGSGGATYLPALGPGRPAGCPGDVDGNGSTDTSDITLTVSNLGAGAPGATGTPGDADGDGDTDTADVTFIVSSLGCSS